MREIEVSTLTQTIKDMCIEANHFLTPDMKARLESAAGTETSPVGKKVLSQLQDNLKIAGEEMIPICQDTGMAVIFLEVGQDVHFIGGDLEEAVQEGIRRGYVDGYLRKSVVKDPLIRENTGDNTPGVIHYKIVPGDQVKITVAPKGFGSENMSAVRMLTPAAGVEGVLDFIEETVSKAGPNPCPPLVVGVCVGGTMDKAAVLAKKATMRPVGTHNGDPRCAGLEEEALKRINKLGIGPGGFGGSTTALAVNIDFFPTHIAGLPVAVNICCHVARHASAEI